MSRRFVPAILVLALVLLLGYAPDVAAQTTEADVYVAQAILDIDEKKYDEALANLKKALEAEADHMNALRDAWLARIDLDELLAGALDRARLSSTHSIRARDASAGGAADEQEH